MHSRFFLRVNRATYLTCGHSFPLRKILTLVVIFGALLPALKPTPAQGEIPGYVVLPLSIVPRSNQAALRVNLNGQSTMLILDTGATTTLLDNRFYQGARSKSGNVGVDQLPPELRRKVDANGTAAQVGYIDSLRSGAMDFGKGPVVVTDLSRMFGEYNNYHHSGAIAGLLGEDVLHRYAAIIDWRRHGVYLNTDPSKRLKLGPALIRSGWTAVPMQPTNARHFAVSCTVSEKPVRLVVDTGAGFTSFTPGIVPLDVIYNRDTGSSMSHLASTTSTFSMIGGDSAMHPATVKHWKIGNYELTSSTVAVCKLPAGLTNEESAGEGPILGVLGAELLAKNSAIIDIAGSTLYLKPASR